MELDGDDGHHTVKGLSPSGLYTLRVFPGDSAVKSLPEIQKKKMHVQFLDQEDPLEEGMTTHSSILAWESHEQRSLTGYNPWGRKELDMTGQQE